MCEREGENRGFRVLKSQFSAQFAEDSAGSIEAKCGEFVSFVTLFRI